MLVAGVVEDQVEDHPDPPSVGLGQQLGEVGLRAEPRVDRGVIGHVVPRVEAGRRVDRGQPDRIDAQAVLICGQVVQVIDQPPEIAEAVAVTVGEAAWVDLVDDAASPPVAAKGEQAI